mgnify:CR=1 FL=1
MTDSQNAVTRLADAAGAHAVLVGEALMTARNPAALIAEFLADFQISARDTAHAIHTACVAGDWRQVGELAHRLKSSSRAVGAMQLGEICAALEQAGRNQDGDRIPGLAGDLAAALDAAAHRMTEPQTTDSAG